MQYALAARTAAHLGVEILVLGLLATALFAAQDSFRAGVVTVPVTITRAPHYRPGAERLRDPRERCRPVGDPLQHPACAGKPGRVARHQR
jgi:hypothetical protein